ncbi:MAG: aldehyde dehydrogenase family protein, partial [Actinobacteria bacterium]|nr:aldehyde dehydrogenase family protein [Actinomycetota bacterium]
AGESGPWSKMTGQDRGKVLLQIADAISSHQSEFEFLEAIDVGKPVTGVRYSDLPISLDSLSYFAGRAQDLAGSSKEVGTFDVFHRSRLEPFGTVLEVLPWNGPLWTGVQRMAAILAAGNVAVIKPAEIASVSFTYLASIIADILPPGVLTVLPGSGSKVGAQLTTHPDIDMVSLTGSVETGAQVLRDTAHQIKTLSLELGGKNPNIILNDADLDSTLMWSVMGAFANSGQICVSGSRILIQRGIYDEFVSRFVADVEKLSVGDPLDESIFMGSVVGETHFKKVWEYIDSAIATKQGTLVTGGVPYTDEFRSNGWFIKPTVFADVASACAIACEEIFGPVVTLTPFDEIDEAVAIANDSDFGLSAGVFTQDLNRAATVAHALQAGQVYINQWFAPGVLQAPSAGYKQSGLGAVGIEKYLQTKNIFTRINNTRS